MVTEKADMLAERMMRQRPGSTSAYKASNLLWRELVDNCQPTAAEFVRHTYGMTITETMLFDVMVKAGFWPSASP